MLPDPEFPVDETLDYDLMNFEERDLYDELVAEDFRSLMTGLPARPGTLR